MNIWKGGNEKKRRGKQTVRDSRIQNKLRVGSRRWAGHELNG